MYVNPYASHYPFSLLIKRPGARTNRLLHSILYVFKLYRPDFTITSNDNRSWLGDVVYD